MTCYSFLFSNTAIHTLLFLLIQKYSYTYLVIHSYSEIQLYISCYSFLFSTVAHSLQLTILFEDASSTILEDNSQYESSQPWRGPKYLKKRIQVLKLYILSTSKHKTLIDVMWYFLSGKPKGKHLPLIELPLLIATLLTKNLLTMTEICGYPTQLQHLKMNALTVIRSA